MYIAMVSIMLAVSSYTMYMQELIYSLVIVDLDALLILLKEDLTPRWYNLDWWWEFSRS